MQFSGLQSDVQDALTVPYLDRVDSSSPERLRESFLLAPEVDLTQSWHEKPDPDFTGATVRLGWSEDGLLIFAELEDRDIFNSARQLNEKTWLLGDVLEIFIQREGEAGYVEFHVTPHNQHLQLKFDGPGRMAHAMILEDAETFRSSTWIEPENDRWFVYAEVPARSLGGCSLAVHGETWRFSFSRYDYSRNRKDPVLSSTSPHREPGFHRLDEWRTLTLK